MTTRQPMTAHPLDADIDAAVRAVAPQWPLDQQIAVNPYWGFVDRPFEEVDERLARLCGTRLSRRSGEYREAWRQGDIPVAALERALEETPEIPRHAAIAALAGIDGGDESLPLLSDLIDRRLAVGAGPRWADVITQQISQHCASYFDEHQADWHRRRDDDLYSNWHRGLENDHAVEPLMHATTIRSRVARAPIDARDAIDWSLAQLKIAHSDHADFLRVCLLRIQGWASWCAYLAWQARLQGREGDATTRELLAIRVVWEVLLLDEHPTGNAVAHEWHGAWATRRDAAHGRLARIDRLWQRAHEIAYQSHLARLLARKPRETAPREAGRAAAQLVFCIDVRSERLRRAVEALAPDVETRGFAGFFGLPIRYTRLGEPTASALLPGLLAPRRDVTQTSGDAGHDEQLATRRHAKLQNTAATTPFAQSPTGSFSLVETRGLGYAVSLLRRHFGAAPARTLSADDALRPILRPSRDTPPTGAAAEDVSLAANILRAMGLTRDFGRLLVFVGHGSEADNNPQEAALQCGACGGHAGDTNARVLASLLNDPAIRLALAGEGIEIPPDTVAIAAMHHTVTDEIVWFDRETVPKSHRAQLEQLSEQLVQAGQVVRRERAPSLGLEELVDRPDRLLQALRRRTRDWAQTRPEWGLADNAAFIIAPRARTRGINLSGRCFLHDYSSADDPDGKILELIMTAPMVVAHWINMQYYASTVDPIRYGSGNKTLHNVVGGRIGVFEGNTGDLRTGLSWQSVHDGQRFMHTPLRLTVVIDAPRAAIDAVIDTHPVVRNLVENRWVHVFRFDGEAIEHRQDRHWRPWPSGDAMY